MVKITFYILAALAVALFIFSVFLPILSIIFIIGVAFLAGFLLAKLPRKKKE